MVKHVYFNQYSILFFDPKLEIQKLELSKDFVCTAAHLVVDNSIEPHGSKGRVEVFYNGTWGPVCGDYHWDFTDANIVCRQLGFPGALVTARTSQSRRRASGQREMWFRSPRCEGNEMDLTNCYHNGWSSYCYDRKEAYVKCITGDESFFCFDVKLDVLRNNRSNTICCHQMYLVKRP